MMTDAAKPKFTRKSEFIGERFCGALHLMWIDVNAYRINLFIQVPIHLSIVEEDFSMKINASY